MVTEAVAVGTEGVAAGTAVGGVAVVGTAVGAGMEAGGMAAVGGTRDTGGLVIILIIGAMAILIGAGAVVTGVVGVAVIGAVGGVAGAVVSGAAGVAVTAAAGAVTGASRIDKLLKNLGGPEVLRASGEGAFEPVFLQCLGQVRLTTEVAI